MDQDTRDNLSFKSRQMKYSSQNQVTIGNKDMVFDPASNKSVMSSLFDYYANKLQEEDEHYVSMYYEKQEEDKTSLEAKVDDEIITTKPYYRDSLKYVDMIMQLNGSKDVDLSQYDEKKEQNSNPVQKRRTTKKKNKSIFG
jgi:gamma-glutamyl-gamma-aminobutyrate hydrolase PuuD